MPRSVSSPAIAGLEFLTRFTPLEGPAAYSGDEDEITFGANTGFKALLAPLETFSNGVNEPSHWKVKDLLTRFRSDAGYTG
jgi:hypothetical protein